MLATYVPECLAVLHVPCVSVLVRASLVVIGGGVRVAHSRRSDDDDATILPHGCLSSLRFVWRLVLCAISVGGSPNVG